MSHQRRKKKLVNPRLQFRLVGSFLGVAGLGLLVEVIALDALLQGLDVVGPHGSVSTAELLTRAFALSFAALVPLMLLVGIVITHRIAGPAYRLERYLESVARGEDTGPCRIRKGDEFQSLCARLNDAVDALRVQGAASVEEDGAGAPSDAREQAA